MTKPAQSHRCAECAAAFTGPPEARFCSAKHRHAYHNRSAKRGKVAVPLLLAWAAGRRRKGDEAVAWAFRELCALAGQWNREDRDAGRMPAAEFILPKHLIGWKAVDLT